MSSGFQKLCFCLVLSPSTSSGQALSNGAQAELAHSKAMPLERRSFVSDLRYVVMLSLSKHDYVVYTARHDACSNLSFLSREAPPKVHALLFYLNAYSKDLARLCRRCHFSLETLNQIDSRCHELSVAFGQDAFSQVEVILEPYTDVTPIKNP
jgi:hypothetical protein